MGSLKNSRFIRARFSPVTPHSQDLEKDIIRSLPDLIDFNAEANPDHTFCIQAEARPPSDSGTQFGARRISFKDLKNAVGACSEWLVENVGQSRVPDSRPVALYIESDVGLFIYLAALLTSGIPALLLSARLSAASVNHLLKETNAQSILLSKRTEHTIAADVKGISDVIRIQPYTAFLQSSAKDQRAPTNSTFRRTPVREWDCNALILHSSGTTGLPKPIRLAHRYILGYAACHLFPADEAVDWCNLSTLPLYHGFGLLAPCLSLSIGMTCCFPPSSTIPAAHSTLELLETFKAGSLMTVPSILEDIVNLAPAERASGFSLLKPLRFVAVGGGPLKPEVGEALVAGGVSVLNHYGATEIGAIAPIFRPGADYDWRYLRLRTDLGLELQQASSESVPEHEMRYRLVGYPIGWNRPFYIQDEILKRPGSKYVEVKILGRQDDLIVLKTGEKVSPQGIEEVLMKDPTIKTAVCVGQGRFELAVLIEPSNKAPADADQLVEHVWQLVCLANRSVDQHAQISSERAVIIKPSHKVIPRSDKGSVMRREVHDLFEEEINAAYEALDLESFASSATLNTENLEDGITSLIGTVLGQDVWFRSEDDLFELGMNSLQATRLARFLNSSLSKLLPRDREDVRITAAFIYQHPSVSSLAKAIRAALSSRSESEADMQDRTIQMQALADELVEEIRTDQPRNRIAFDFVDNSSLHHKVVLLTGSTGNLGCHMLGRLVRMRQITRIICLNRAKPGGTVSDLRERQEQVNATAGIVLDSEVWDKIEFVAANTQAPDLGLTQEQRTQLARTVTHVVHLAWPMDFNRKLHSFKPQLQALKALVSLCRDAHHARGGNFNPRLVFASSIAVVRHYSDLTGSSVVPEERLPDPRVAAAMGYAEAKWVCEEFLFRVGQMYPDEVTPMVVRIGQLSGPEREGIWKTEEHFPALVKASQMISAFPSLKGNFSWLPVDRAAAALSDILLQDRQMPSRFYHLENPIRQPLADVGTFIIDELKLQQKRPIPFETWLDRVAATGYASSLMNFFQNEFRSLADGSTALETSASRKASLYLWGESGIGKDLVVEYIRRWKKLGFLT